MKGKWYLRTSVEEFSAGTQVDMLMHPDDLKFPKGTVNHGFATIRILAGNRRVIDIEPELLVQRRKRSMP